MKPYSTWLLIVLSTGIACKSPDKKVQKEPGSKDTAISLPASKEGNNELRLNNGNKWHADSTTNTHVKAMQDLVKTFAGKKEKKLDDYHQVSNQLLDAVNKLLAACKMTGPDHEALHQWLEPLLDEIKEQKNASGMPEAASAFLKIEKNLDKYNEYFQ